jgi:hypothetical protein
METTDKKIDSEGTTLEEAQHLLTKLGETGFSGDVGKLALALGRDEEEIGNILNGEAEVDEDLLMKIRGIARERDLEIE